MSYQKQPKVCQDYALGLNSINNAIGNDEATMDAYQAEHFMPDSGNAGYRRPVGMHNTPLIPRAVCSVTSTSGFPSDSFPGSNVEWQWGPHFDPPLAREQTGIYLLRADIFQLGSWAEASPVAADETEIRIIHCRFGPRVPLGKNYFVFTLKEFDGTEFVNADYLFSFRIHGPNFAP
jgi:hypothetical protein